MGKLLGNWHDYVYSSYRNLTVKSWKEAAAASLVFMWVLPSGFISPGVSCCSALCSHFEMCALGLTDVSAPLKLLHHLTGNHRQSVLSAMAARASRA